MKAIGSIGLIIAYSIILTSTAFTQQVPAPKFNYESGKYNSSISVSIHTDSAATKIYYTADGSIPDENSNLYDGNPIPVFQHAAGDSATFAGDNDPAPGDEYLPLLYRSLLLKAIAIDQNSAKSEVVSAEYVIDRVEATFDIPYDEPPLAGGSKHTLDIYQPIGVENNEVLFFVYGGAWKQGDKNIYLELGNTMAGYYGITTVIINYELSTDPWNAVHPDHINDVANAFKWVYENIQNYGGDPEKIYLFGQSAGAHLVSLLATDTNYLTSRDLSAADIQGVISMSGAYDLYDLVEWPNNPLGLNAQEALEYKALCLNAFGSWEQGVLDDASPEKFIKLTQPPFRIIALNVSDTFKDMPGFSSQSQNFYSAILGLKGPDVELKLINESDIPAKVLAMDFPADYDGHYEEIYAINTRDWDSYSSRLVAEYLKSAPGAPKLSSPAAGTNNLAPNPRLTWHKNRQALYYQLQVAADINFSDGTIIFNSPIGDTSWTLPDLNSATKYYWRVKTINGLGESEWSETRDFQTGTPTGIAPSPEIVPRKMTIDLYPNPFNSAVHLKINIGDKHPDQSGRILIYDILGREVYRKEVKLSPGDNHFTWQAGNKPGGLYLVNIECGNKRYIKKVLFVK